MKACIIFTFFALCGIASSEDYMRELAKLAKACLTENKADMKDVENLIAGKILPENAGENLKCAMKCFMEKSGFLTATGKFDAKVYRDKLTPYRPAEEVDKVIEACKNTNGSNSCDMDFKLLNCMVQKKPPK